MKIRKAIRKDLKQMLEIVKLNNTKYPKELINKEFKEMFSGSLLKPTYIIAEDKERIVAFAGFVLSWIDNVVTDIFWVNTHPNYQGKGVQKKLLENLIERIKKLRKPKVKMILISTKIPKFHKKFGFKKIVSKYDGDYILMGLKLG